MTSISKCKGLVVSASLVLSVVGFATGGSAAASGGDCIVDWEAPVPLHSYRVAFEGIENPAIKDLFERASRLIALRDRPPATIGGIERRMLDDLARFEEILRSEGYFAGRFAPCIRRDGDVASVTVAVSPGPGYGLASYRVDFVGGAVEGISEARIAEIAETGLGKRARAIDIVGTEHRLLEHLARNARPLAKVVDRSVTVDHPATAVTVRLRIDPGPRATFGPVTIEGLQTIEEVYVRRLIAWSANEPFDAGKLETLRTRLLATGLFATVVIARAGEVDDGGRLAVTVTVFEAAARSIGAGAKYSTAEGLSGVVLWEHRNFGGHSEDLKVALEAGRITQQASADIRWPDFRRAGEDLVSGHTLKRIDSEAFDELGVQSAIGVRLPVAERWRGAADVTLEASRLRERDQTDTSTLLGLPLAASYDGTDSMTRPTQGVRFRVDATPYAGHLSNGVGFVVGTVGGSGYAALDEDRRFVLAAKARVGSIVGEPVRELPANKRFYVGGDRSVRGYKFQRVGPLDGNNDPTGGRSLFEAGTELRAVAWRSIEVVPFVEGGGVYDEVYPDFAETSRWAAGIGLRHYTLVGPIRLDFAFPLNRRRDVDDPFQFYISLGQAF